MNREEAIANIEALYPADSQYPDGAEVGKRLLEQAKMEKQGWRMEPDEVLIRYAELCIAEEGRQQREYDRNRKMM